MLRWCTLALLVVLGGCNNEVFIIDGGNHRPGTKVKVHSGTELGFTATFDESSIYTTRDPANQGDINKLMGFSDCSSQHHQNSARFGWRWFDDALQIFAYTYADGVRDWQYIGDVEHDQPYHYQIDMDGAEYVFTLEGYDSVRMNRGCMGNGGVKYRLWPYFGGDETAPHNIRIHIVED